MCKDCWESAGRPTELPATFDRFAELVADLYDLAPAGGPLHAELDDWNLDHDLIEPYPGMIFEEEDDGEDDGEDNTAEVYRISGEIADLLNAMPESQRYAAVAKIDGMF